MPLRALNGEQNVNSFEHDAASWKDLKGAYRRLGLKMPCCSVDAVPKTSKLGNFFFAHKQRGECGSEPESAEHIYLKSLIAIAAARAGWSVVTEFPGRASDGGNWIADVYCEKGNARVALEVQLSYITLDELKFRTERYEKSGVRVAWFASKRKFKEAYAVPSKALPIFYITEYVHGQTPRVRHFDKAVPDFVGALLGKKVRWKTEPWEYTIFFIEDSCWKCNKDVKQIYGFAIDVHSEIAMTVPHASAVLSKIAEFISNEELRALGLNTVGRFEGSEARSIQYPNRNICLRCGAPQNNYHLMKHLNDEDRPSGSASFVSPRESTGEWVIEE